MENKLQIRKIYIDSRFKTAGSKSSSDFYIDLPESISIPDNTVCFVDNVVIPNSWKTIDAYNNKLYVRRTKIVSGTLSHVYKVIQLAENNYSATTLRDHLTTQLNNAFGGPTAISIVYDQVLLRFDIKTNDLNIKLTFYTDKELTETNNFTETYDKNNLQSANELLSIFEMSMSEVYQTGIINLMRYRNLYLTCPSLSNYSTLSPNGSSNVIKKIPVSAGYGEIIYNNTFSLHDYIDVSKLMIKVFEFQVCDSYGNVVNLRNMPVSFSLVLFA